MDKKELIVKLRIIGGSESTRKHCEEILSISEEDYLKAYAPKPIKPNKKELINNPHPNDSSVKSLTRITNVLFITFVATLAYVIIDFIISRLIGNLSFLSNIFSVVYAIHLISLVGLIIIYVILLYKRSLYKVNILEFKNIDKTNDEIRKYNQTEYTKEVEKYNEELSQYDTKVLDVKKQYQIMIDDAKESIRKVDVLLEDYKDIVSKKFAPIACELADLIEDGRADDVKEAINVYIADQNAKLLLQEQQRKNDILADDLSRQRQEQERYNNEMLVLQSQQARELEKQTEQMKMQREEMLRQQKQMNQAERNRQSSLKNASDRYKSASQRYSTAVKTGNKFYAADAKRDMDEAYADMLKNQ